MCIGIGRVKTEGWKWIQSGGLANEEDDPCIRMHENIAAPPAGSQVAKDATNPHGRSNPLAVKKCTMSIINEQMLLPRPLDLDRRDAAQAQYPRRLCDITKDRFASKYCNQDIGTVPDAYPGGLRAKARFQSQRNHWHTSFGPQ